MRARLPGARSRQPMKLIRWAAVCSVAALLATGAAYPQAVKVDEAIGTCQTTGGVSGILNSIGSDTLSNLMTLWAEGFQNPYPNVKIQIEGKGSSTAPPALIMGTAQIGPMSRAMKSSEEDEFEKTFGYKPTQIRVAVDALAVSTTGAGPVSRVAGRPSRSVSTAATRPRLDDHVGVSHHRRRAPGRPSGLVRPMSLRRFARTSSDRASSSEDTGRRPCRCCG
jgi:hypothetical protein